MSEQKEQQYTYVPQIDRKTIDANKAEFIYKLFKEGIDLSIEEEDALVEHGYIKNEERRGGHGLSSESFDFNVNRDKTNLAKLEQSDTRRHGKYIHSGREIKSSEWKPKSVIFHTDEFYKFINTMIYSGFQKKSNYKPLELYIQQAHNWLSENDSMENYLTIEEQKSYAEQEIERCKVNSLYFLDKYLMIKDSSLLDEDMTSYISHPVHEVLAFLFDCGYSMFIGKPRQIAATTTFMGLFLKRMAFYKNTFVKFVTMDVDTAEEILEDKMKYPVSEIPDWLRPTISSDSATSLKFVRKIKGKKGVRSGANSKISIVAPSVSAINGGAPQVVGIDEAAYIKFLGKMMREGRPTMFRTNPSTGEMVMMRQLIVWSTGATEEGEKHTRSKSFEDEFNVVLDAWKKKNFKYGIIPVFFDWTTRPGITQKVYEEERENYMGNPNDPDKDSKIVQFKLTYPSRIEDMFLSHAKTLVPLTWIEKQEKRIANLMPEQRPVYGYFEPIVDKSDVIEKHGDVPYKIKGAEFIPTTPDSPNASCMMFLRPEKNWVHRYFQGTDPIASDTGVSLMASAIFDAKMNTISCVMNFRHNDHQYNFLQCLLMGIYYDTERKEGVPHLIEANIGTNLKNYIDKKGFSRSIVYNKQLPPALHGGTSKGFGVDNRGTRTDFIIGRMQELLYTYGDRIYHDEVFRQLRYFTCTVSDAGKEKWGTPDKRRHPDDLLFAIVFSYLCRICYGSKNPENISAESKRYREEYRMVMDKNGNQTRQWVRIPIYK